MLSDRNTTSHIYDEETAKRIYGNIRCNYPMMVKVFDGEQGVDGRFDLNSVYPFGG
jgi:hypothetical protein